MAGDGKVKGTRPLDNDEIRQVSTCFTGTFEAQLRLYEHLSMQQLRTLYPSLFTSWKNTCETTFRI